MHWNKEDVVKKLEPSLLLGLQNALPIAVSSQGDVIAACSTPEDWHKSYWQELKSEQGSSLNTFTMYHHKVFLVEKVFSVASRAHIVQKTLESLKISYSIIFKYMSVGGKVYLFVQKHSMTG